MQEAKFILSKKKIVEQYNKLKDLGVNISYSYKTNNEVGHVLQDFTDSEFSIHAFSEVDLIKEKSKIWFFMQAQSDDEIIGILKKGVRRFVIDNEIDLENILMVVGEMDVVIDLLVRMKFQEHRITAGKYYIYGMESKKVNEIIDRLREDRQIGRLGVHIHRKSQNVSEWEIKDELIESLSIDSLDRLDIINIGGGLPVKYRTYTSEIESYIFDKIMEVRDWFIGEVYVEPGRFIAGPAVKLKCYVVQVRDGTIVVNCSIYNGVLDSHITDIRLLVEGELNVEAGTANSDYGSFKDYKIKGNTPTRDDIFRYKVRLRDIKVGDEIIFLNAGAYNYTTDFCSLDKLKCEVVE
jgi:ornithine decarboxylase